MPETTNQSAGVLPKKLREELENIANSVTGIRPEFTQAIRDFLTAISYEDKTLVASTRNALLDALRGAVQDSLPAELERSKLIMEAVRSFVRKKVAGFLFEDDVEEPKKAIEVVINERIVSLTGLRDEVVAKLEQMGYPIDNAQDLQDGIRDLRRFLENLFKEWPRVGEPPAPLDKKAIEEARSQIVEKGLRKEDMKYPKKTG